MNGSSDFPHPAYKRTVLSPLFDTVTAHHVEAFRSINRAHLVMLAETGILPAGIAAAIARGLVDIDRSVDTATLTYTGEFEDYFFLVEAELAKRTGADTAGCLHTARSRNDMDHTVFRLALKDRTDAMLDQAHALAQTLIEKATEERDTLIVAYTHGQPAQPSTFGHYLAAALEVLLRDIRRLQQACDELDRCPMGAAAITTSGFPIDRNRIAELLGFARPLVNSYGCIASVDYVTGLYSAIRLIFLHLGRVIQDLQFWSAFEVGQLHVPDSLVQISSIMPQKRNPVPIEHLRHLASLTCGRCETMIGTMHNTPFTDMNDSEGEVQQAGYAAFESGGRVLDLLAALVADCTIDAGRVAANSDAACITVTELADTLVREDKLSFRQAHEIAAETARAMIDAGRPLGDGYRAFSEAFHRLAGKASSLDEGAFSNAVSADQFVAVRNRLGGPAPAAMDDALADYRRQLCDLCDVHASAMARTRDARTALNAAFDALIQE